MAAITEGMHEGEFIGELAMGIGYHVDEITLQTPEDLAAGSLLSATETGTPTATAGAPFSAGGGTVGNGAVSAVSADAGAMEGDWLVEIVGAAGATAAFKVLRPDGSIDGQGNVGTAYNGTGSINFTIADGATDYGPNMFVPITVAYDGDDHAPEYVEYDGTGTVDAVLMKATDASAADVLTTALVRGPAVINKNDLTWASGIDASEQAAALATLLASNGIKAV
jgi:hypothetical protein